MQQQNTNYRVEIVYLDKNNKLTELKQAFKTIIREYDDNNTLIKAYVSIDPSKS